MMYGTIICTAVDSFYSSVHSYAFFKCGRGEKDLQKSVDARSKAMLHRKCVSGNLVQLSTYINIVFPSGALVLACTPAKLKILLLKLT